jgi:nucleoside-diphosphate-sugar epimerase
MTLAITGGTGFVGQALLDRAIGDGGTVQALARRPQLPRRGIDWVRGDLDDKGALGRLVDGAEAVIHVAGLTNAADNAEFERCNVGGTMAVIEAAIAAGVPRFVFVSSLSAREPELSAYGASKLRAEKLVRASPLDWTIVRPPAIYGPRDDGMFELFRGAKWGVVPTPKHGKASVIHVDDLARLLMALVPGGEAVTHMTFEPDDGKPGGWDHYELARAIGWAVGKRPWVLGLSRGAMMRAAKIDMALRKGKAKLTLDRASYFSHPDWVVSADAAVPCAIWRPQVETREGLSATAQWYRAEGWL